MGLLVLDKERRNLLTGDFKGPAVAHRASAPVKVLSAKFLRTAASGTAQDNLIIGGLIASRSSSQLLRRSAQFLRVVAHTCCPLNWRRWQGNCAS